MINKTTHSSNKKSIIGWKEWCCFTEFALPVIKAKIDTGAKTSALHADKIEVFQKDNADHVRFTVHPIQKNREITRICEAKIKDHRYVTSSNGERDKRYVIETLFKIGEHEFTADITLTSRYGMKFRMLLGRDALIAGKLLVDPKKSFAMGKQKNAVSLYF